jgi:hypothetical protein
VREQLLRRRRRVRVALEPPSADGLADLVDDLVGLLARPAVELERELGGCLLSPDPPTVFV